MTPLAMKFARDLTLPIKRRKVDDCAELLPHLGETHCFDVSAVWAGVKEALSTADAYNTVVHLQATTFLPAERTWIELPPVGGHRMAFVIWKSRWQDHEWFELATAHHIPEENYITSMKLGGFRFDGKTLIHEREADAVEMDRQMGRDGRSSVFVSQICSVILLLDIINSPALVHLQRHNPHKGLLHDFRKAGLGNYPLHGWHEVKIRPQIGLLTDEELAGPMTGRKCLHFVRAHRRRYRSGKETVVSPHWRGDPAIGIMRTRYRVEDPDPPPDGAHP